MKMYGIKSKKYNCLMELETNYCSVMDYGMYSEKEYNLILPVIREGKILFGEICEIWMVPTREIVENVIRNGYLSSNKNDDIVTEKTFPYICDVPREDLEVAEIDINWR